MNARPDDVFPRGRMGYDISANCLLLHTIQTEEALEGLASNGVLVPDVSRAEPLFGDVDDRIRVAGVPVDAALRHWPGGLREELEQSWEFVLDPANYGRYESWQATVHCLHEHDVVEAVRIAP